METMELTAAMTPTEDPVPVFSPGVDGESGAAVVGVGGAAVVDVEADGGGVVVLVSMQSQKTHDLSRTMVEGHFGGMFGVAQPVVL